jgi:hypothetical protein
MDAFSTAMTHHEGFVLFEFDSRRYYFDAGSTGEDGFDFGIAAIAFGDSASGTGDYYVRS